MSLNFCDLLVLGSDLSGVMTATLLAKRGMNVLILDDDDEGEPTPNVTTGLSSRSFKSLLGKLMIPDSKLQMIQENKIGCQVVFPKHRMDMQRSRPLFLKEVSREFPQERETLEELLVEIDQLRENHLEDLLSFFPIIGPKERKRFVRWFHDFPRAKALSIWNRLTPTLQCFIKVQLRFFSRSPLFDPPLAQMLLFLPPENDASFSIKGGIKELKKLFYDKLDYFGGMVHPLGDDSFQILTKGREVKGVQLGRYNFPTRCRFLLGNMNIQKFYNAVPSPFLSFLFDRSKQKVESLVPVEERSVVQYETWRDILPSPMKENLVYVGDPSAPLEGSNYLEINVHPFPKPPETGADTLMTVTYNLGSKKEPLFEKINAEIDSRLHRLIPFANSHLRRTFPPSAEGETQKTGETSELFPEQISGDYTQRMEKIARKNITYEPSFFFPTLTSPHKNLFILGPNILDWLGMEGKMLSALRAVEMIWGAEMKVRNP